ncbi:type II secretion system protein [Mesotoga sp. B105.6.4]|uniref:type II secretion system protein n=1 Tax=Mesotoga sp. B105.6.4 TaxID=1582224 RepID=UPI000CCC99F4|nr:type II secretion system protein [Mesotoga sp. B105.6.4]PNS40960.1 hypothetical protein RJ60_05800 [Mesotoga sp. B105.6.4]RAM60369.1 hypothetical protein DS67_00485 [Mesotoga sp. SC_4PWA21]
MNNRKRGFSLVELLIVLAVIAALIATITPVALNAIQKAKATQVAQNLKTLASAFENKAYVEGATGISGLNNLKDLARDVNDKYELYYTATGGVYTAVVLYNEADVNTEKVIEALANATTGTTAVTTSWKKATTSGVASVSDTSIGAANKVKYEFSFRIY